jgi:hypothetical protein
VKNRLSYYFQILISIFLLTACVGTLNVQVEKPGNTSPAQTKSVVSGSEALAAAVPTFVSGKSTLASQSGSSNMAQTSQPIAIDPSSGSGLSGYKNPIFTYDPVLASSTVVESRPEVPAAPDSPYWQALPDRTQITLIDYPISEAQYKPQIFIYPVNQYRLKGETAGKVIDALKNLLQGKPAGQAATPVLGQQDQFPFLPLNNARQIFHGQVNYFAFKDGRGVRYLTQFSQGINPINNHDLIYTYQGLTNDGEYYISAILPVNSSILASGTSATPGQDYNVYIAGLVQQFDNSQPTDFKPVLTYMDDMMESFEIK